MNDQRDSTGTTVLVVDDSTTIRRQVKSALAERPYEILEAEDGLAALEVIQERPELALVICDVNMPRMNGLELLGKLHEEHPELPVVMLTTEGQPKLIQEARSKGARGWLVKPFQPHLLVKAVDRIAAVA